MMLKSILFICLIVSTLALDSPVYENDVLVLTEDNFDAALKENRAVFVKFYAEWCGHCKKLAPEYAKAATELKSEGIVLAHVNVPDNQEIGTRFNIQGFPTLMFFLDGIKMDYNGGRDAASIARFARKALQPAVVTVNDKAEFEKLLKDNKLVVSAALEPSAEGYAVYEMVAKALRNDATFVAGTVDVVGANVRVHRKDLEPAVYTEALEQDSLQKFIKANSFPLVDQLGPDNYLAYYQSGLPIVFAFVDPAQTDRLEEVKTVLKAVGMKYNGQVLVTYTDGAKYRGQVERMGLPAGQFPSLAVFANDLHYNYPLDQAFDEEHLLAWFELFVTKKLEPTIKSEETPAEQTGPVYKLVANEFIKVVMDPSKDVLVKFYAPWCGHCKSLAPIYEELAKSMKEVSNLVIAEFDATANDIPVPAVKVQGFPTLYFFPANDKTPVDYEGDRSLADLTSFIKSHSSLDLSLVKIPESNLNGKDEL